MLPLDELSIYLLILFYFISFWSRINVKFFIIFVCITAILFIPFKFQDIKVNLVFFLKPIFGELSVLHFYLIALSLFLPITFLKNEIKLLKYYVVAGVFIFYPMTFGITLSDPYSLGYDNLILIITVGLVGFLLCCLDYHILSMGILLSLIGYCFKVLSSTNLWDYILDPWLLLSVYIMYRKVKPINNDQFEYG